MCIGVVGAPAPWWGSCPCKMAWALKASGQALGPASILVFCSIGNRATIANATLHLMGYTNVVVGSLPILRHLDWTGVGGMGGGPQKKAGGMQGENAGMANGWAGSRYCFVLFFLGGVVVHSKRR